jgi:hypothetical protein
MATAARVGREVANIAPAGRGRARLRTSQTRQPATSIAGFEHHATPNSAHVGGTRSRLRDWVSHSLSKPHAHSQHATTADFATTSTEASSGQPRLRPGHPADDHDDDRLCEHGVRPHHGARVRSRDSGMRSARRARRTNDRHAYGIAPTTTPHHEARSALTGLRMRSARRAADE